MKLNDIMKVLEGVAPVALSDRFCREYKMYDNSGIIIDAGEEIKGAVFSLDLSSKAIEEALKTGANLIVTHHPAIYGGVSKISFDDPIAKCIKHGISVISMHLNYDVAPEGIDYHLMCGLGGKDAEVHAEVEGGGYGRFYSVKKCAFAEFAEKVRKTFSDRALFYGDFNKTVEKVTSFCGAGGGYDTMAYAIGKGADVYVTSDLKHHEIAYLLGRGINVVHLTHYSAETYGFKKIYLKINGKLNVPCAFYCDTDLM